MSHQLLRYGLRHFFTLSHEEDGSLVVCTKCGSDDATVRVEIVGDHYEALSDCCHAMSCDEANYIYKVDDLYVGDGPITGFPRR